MARRGLRVIAGTAGGLRLVAPPDSRPTTDRVREALFSALGDAVVDAAVLDLFAGSGALAIEALSRGAARAVLVDRDAAALSACEQNLETTGLADQARVHRVAVAAFLRAAPPAEAPFDLVLADPPYELADGEVTEMLAALLQPRWIATDGRVVLERRAPASVVAVGWTTSWERKYGDTLVTILHPSE
jgi:16S rRNA (guanine966-N2)-methyltransferase